MNALVVGVQQLVTTMRVTGSDASSIDAMVAAQEAMTANTTVSQSTK